jgi:hypothetical protein
LPDDPDGFARFYELIFERPLPRHARDEWVEPLYAAQAEGKGLVVEAFRGSSKTTTLSIAFTAFRLGQEPHKNVLLIQASDQAARSTSQQIADLIERHPGWQTAFSDVKPDRKVSWSLKGYELMHAGAEHEAWRALVARTKGKDPSLLGLGYRSRAIIGKHPTGLLVVDDIHDENNTRSQRELATVSAILQGTILPTVMPQAWQLFVGTPWTANDVLAYLKSTGRFTSVATPIYRNVQHGAMDEPVPTWPEKFPAEEIAKARQLSGESEFARMYLLDLAAAEGVHLRREWLQEFPAADIRADWPVVMGVDYASSADKLKDGRRDYFAVAVGRAIPGGGGIVLVEGVRMHATQAEAQHELQRLAAFYSKPSIIGVEAVGKGEEFFQLMQRDWGLHIVDFNPGRSSKGERFEKTMAPMFERGVARVVNVESPFLRAFREEWLRWPQGEHDDCLDAVYYMIMAAQSYLRGGQRREKRESPWFSLGRE